jgi:hypothetical protein
MIATWWLGIAGARRSCAPSVQQAGRRCCTKAHGVSVCFRCMLQVFHMDVVKVDRDVAYVAMAIHACYKRLFQMFHLFLRHMLQAFYLDVANVLSDVVCVCNGFQVF